MRFVAAVVRVGVLIGVAVLLPAGLRAEQMDTHPELDLAFTYTAQRSNLTAGSSFWAQGGSAELSATVYHGFGLAANVSGTHSGSISSSGVGLTMVTTTFGPRYTWSRSLHQGSERRINLFGEALIGIVNGLDSVFPSTNGPQTTANNLALQIGGGADWNLTRHLAIRPVQAAWLRTQLPNGGSNVQNNLQLSAGIVFRIAR